MEKIRERSLKWLWLPKVLLIPVAGCTIFFGMFPPFGIVFALAFLLAGVALLVVSVVYKIYFYYQLSLDINAVCEGDGCESASYLFVFALSTVTLGIYGKYWEYKVAQRLQANAPRYGFKMIVGGKEILVLDLLSSGWISAWEFCKNMNRMAKVYNQNGLPDVMGGEQQ